MDDGNVLDMLIPMLQRLQADVSDIKRDVADLKVGLGDTNARIDETNARLSAHSDMTETRFMALEHAILDVGARAYSGSIKYESTTKRHERELRELRDRVSRLEAREDER